MDYFLMNNFISGIMYLGVFLFGIASVLTAIHNGWIK